MHIYMYIYVCMHIYIIYMYIFMYIIYRYVYMNAPQGDSKVQVETAEEEGKQRNEGTL